MVIYYHNNLKNRFIKVYIFFKEHTRVRLVSEDDLIEPIDFKYSEEVEV